MIQKTKNKNNDCVMLLLLIVIIEVFGEKLTYLKMDKTCESEW